jgi:hypothetical protein
LFGIRRVVICDVNAGRAVPLDESLTALLCHQHAPLSLNWSLAII